MNQSLFVISGPSGAGKGTILSLLLRDSTSLGLTVSATTRKPRSGEQEGISYHFLELETFKSLINKGEFLEWAQVHNNYYGTLKSEITRLASVGKRALLEIDVQGALQVKEQFPDAHLVFIAPPSLEVLEERLSKRATETVESLSVRMENAKQEMQLAQMYDFVIVNHDLSCAVDELRKYINSVFSDSE